MLGRPEGGGQPPSQTHPLGTFALQGPHTCMHGLFSRPPEDTFRGACLGLVKFGPQEFQKDGRGRREGSSGPESMGYYPRSSKWAAQAMHSLNSLSQEAEMTA